MARTEVVAVRFAPEEVEALDDVAGQLSRGKCVQLIVQDFLGRTKKSQREAIVRMLFSKPEE